MPLTNRFARNSSYLQLLAYCLVLICRIEWLNLRQVCSRKKDLELTFRRYLQKNNIFLAIVFGELFENLQLLSQLKLRKMAAGNGCGKF
jgi:hypothetical protein